MQFRFLLVVIVLFSACRSDIIPCPEAKVAKLRESTVRNNKIKRYEPQPVTSASERIYQQRHLSVKREAPADKKPESADDWECPRPGTRKHAKMLKENQKKREQLMREASKKRKDANPMNTVLPYSESK